MCDRYGQMVRSLAGHDKGALFCVVGEEGDFLLLADGKRRTLSSPKRKKRRHTAQLTTEGMTAPLTDGVLRARLAVFRKQGGN